MVKWGLILSVFSLIYLIKPNIYIRWFWKKTDIFQQVLSPANYILFMRILGALFLVAGVALLIAGKFKM
jgi:hypothetical protein